MSFSANKTETKTALEGINKELSGLKEKSATNKDNTVSQTISPDLSSINQLLKQHDD